MVSVVTRLAATLSALAISSCAVGVSGSPSPVASPVGPVGPADRVLANPDRITSADGLGDLPTWDPCSVVNPAALPDFGPVRFAKPEAYEYCLIEARTSKGGVEIQVGYLFQSSVRDLEGYKSQPREGRLRVVSVGIEGGACLRWLVFDDGVALVVRTYPVSDHDDPQLCSVSDAMIDQVVAAVVRGRGAGRITLPAATLATIDPCRVITAEMLAKVPGLSNVPPEPAPARHSCEFVNPATESGLVVEFEVGGVPDGGTVEMVGDRITATEPYEDVDEEFATCRTTGQHVNTGYRSAANLMERAAVQVYLPFGKSAAACEASKAVAALLWTALPAI